MGNFANSLHVKWNDTQQLVAAINDSMCEAGYNEQLHGTGPSTPKH